MNISRRKFIELATACGASLAFASRRARASVLNWTERRVVHRVERWTANTRPKLKRTKVQGKLPLVI